MSKIPVASPALVGNERKYVLDCLDTSWISSRGKYVQQFEEEFAHFIGSRYAVACSSGTAALHVALLAAGVQPGDEVIVPTLTYVATANAVLYCGARPVFVESEPASGNIDPSSIEPAITGRTKALIAVHLYGQPAALQPIRDITRKHKLLLIEDAAEAHGAECELDGRWVRVGSIGDAGAFSFFGNKIITTGEGGMVVTDSEETYRRAKQFINQGQDPSRRYWFPVVGFNYRMTNIEAAIGLAQLERIDWHIQRHRELAQQYRQQLAGNPKLLVPGDPARSRAVFWMTCALVDPSSRMSRDEIIERLDEVGIETRPYFPPMHQLPIYQNRAGSRFPVAEDLSRRGLNLPSSPLMNESDVLTVCERLCELT